jgi:hypothetical protein
VHENARIRLARLAIIAIAATAVAAGRPGFALARESGIQLAPESDRYFISKDVGQERWAITYNLDDKTATANVFPLDGGAPTFLSCDITRIEQAPDPANAQYYMDCRAAGSCANAPCGPGQWGAPSAVGPIPGSFLLPTSTRATLSGNVQPTFTARCANSEACHGGGRAPDLLQGSTWDSTFRIPSGEDPGKSYVTPFDGGGSYLLDKVLGIQSAGARMPLGTSLDAAQIDEIRNWILEGAANN